MASGSGEDTMERLREELSDMTPEEIQAVKEKIGLKAFRQKFCFVAEEKNKGKGPKPRQNKNRPMEMSSKRRVQITPATKEREKRDPRFDDVCGTFRPKIFSRDYSFVSDLKAEEKKKVKKQLKKEKKEEKKQKLRQLLNKMTQEEQTREEKKKKQNLIQEWKEKEKERVKEGKKPYFLKKSDVRKLELAEKFKTLKEQDKVQKFIEKKRKRKAKKERRNILQ